MAVQINNLQNQNQPVAQVGWSTNAIKNTIFKTALASAAALIYLGNQPRGSMPNIIEKVVDRIKSEASKNPELCAKVCLGLAIGPEAFKTAEFCYKNPGYPMAFAAGAAGMLLGQKYNVLNK